MVGANIVVYTCHTNGRDLLRDDQNTEGAQFLAFVDQPVVSLVWHQLEVADYPESARRTARRHKVLAHEFIDAEYSLWQDANVSLLVPARQVCEEWLDDCDLAVFRHRTRRCLFDEARVCIEKNLDDRELIEDQVGRYRAAGYQPGTGLGETSVVVRRHTAQVEEFNKLWWQELSAGSVRDQISFMFAARQSGIRVRLITPTKFKHPYFSMTCRPAGAEKLGQPE